MSICETQICENNICQNFNIIAKNYDSFHSVGITKPVLCNIIELPQVIRESVCNKIISGIWVGKNKP